MASGWQGCLSWVFWGRAEPDGPKSSFGFGYPGFFCGGPVADQRNLRGQYFASHGARGSRGSAPLCLQPWGPLLVVNPLLSLD
jgi:hypothetical protein